MTRITTAVLIVALLLAAVAVPSGGARSAAAPTAPAPSPDTVSRGRLIVWHSRTSAQARQFFLDWRTDDDFRDTILARYELWHVDLDVCGLFCPHVRIVPTFRAGPLLIEGYAGKTRFLQHLGLSSPAPSTPPADASPPPEWRPAQTPAAPAPAPAPPPALASPASSPVKPDLKGNQPTHPTDDNSGRDAPEDVPETPPPQPSADTPPLPPPDRFRRTQRREQPSTIDLTEQPADGRSADAATSTPHTRATPEPAVSPRSWLALALSIFNLTHPVGQASTAMTLAAGALSWIISRRRARTGITSTDGKPATAPAACTRCKGYEQQLVKCRQECGREIESLQNTIKQLTTASDQASASVPDSASIREKDRELSELREALAVRRPCPDCPSKDARLRELEALTRELRAELDVTKSQPQRDYVIKVDGTISSESWEWAYKQCLVKFEGTSERQDAVRQLKALRDQHFSGEVAKRQLAKDK